MNTWFEGMNNFNASGLPANQRSLVDTSQYTQYLFSSGDLYQWAIVWKTAIEVDNKLDSFPKGQHCETDSSLSTSICANSHECLTWILEHHSQKQYFVFNTVGGECAPCTSLVMHTDATEAITYRIKEDFQYVFRNSIQ